jgi:hypothetical protein
MVGTAWPHADVVDTPNRTATAVNTITNRDRHDDLDLSPP